MTAKPTESQRSAAWSPFEDPTLTRDYYIGTVRRLVDNARRQMHSGIWLAVEEIEAMLSVIPSTPCVLTPRQTELASKINNLPAPDSATR